MGEPAAIYLLVLKVIYAGCAGLFILLFILGLLEAFVYKLEKQRDPPSAQAVKNDVGSGGEDGSISAWCISIEAE